MIPFNVTTVDLGAESQDDAKVSVEALQIKAQSAAQRLAQLPPESQNRRAQLQLDLARVEIDLDKTDQAWHNAFSAFRYFADQEKWNSAVMACDALFQCNQPQSLAALAHGVWISVTYPIDPQLTVSQLKHIIDETPEDSDGAAVAATTAAYIINLRSDNNSHDDMTLAVGQMLNQVAREHGNAHDQQAFDNWFNTLELDKPEKFLVRLRNVIDVLAQDDWWIDRAALQAKLPE